ncbi:MAG TPA: hypothetical protein VFQ54_11460 [Thermomicrobiales bacterium]|nr:hypothetical protein [Thermomicrobiales bacterium]
MKRFGTSVLVSLVLLGGVMGQAVAADDATPTPLAAAGYPVAIHEGTCASPTAQPAYEIDNTTIVGSGSDPSDTIGGTVNQPVLEASATVKAKLDDVASQPHVIAVHASPTDYNTLIACGQVAGTKEDGKLVVALIPVNGSGVSGVAILDEDTSGVLGLGDDQIKATVYLIAPSQPGEATPSS